MTLGVLTPGDGSREEAVVLRVLELEMPLRVPGVGVRLYTPSGLPSPLDAGRRVEAWPDAAAEVPAVLVVAGRLEWPGGQAVSVAARAAEAEGVAVAWEAAWGPAAPSTASPVALHGLAAVAVRHITAARLERAALLCERAGWLEPGVPVVLVDDDPALAPRVAELAAARDELGVVVLGRQGDDVATPGEAWPSRATLLPWYAGLEELAAVAARAVDEIGPVSGSGLAPGLRAAVRPGSGVPEGAAEVDAWLDTLAARLLEASGTRRGSRAATATTPRGAAIVSPAARRAAAFRVRAQVELRQLQLRVAELEGELAELSRLRSRLEQTRAELERVTTSKTWRYTEGARDVYRTVRSRRGQP